MAEVYYHNTPLVPAAKKFPHNLQGTCSRLHSVCLHWSKGIISHFTALTDELIKLSCSAYETPNTHLFQFSKITTSI